MAGPKPRQLMTPAVVISINRRVAKVACITWVPDSAAFARAKRKCESLNRCTGGAFVERWKFSAEDVVSRPGPLLHAAD